MKTAIVYYSTWGHVDTLAKTIKQGIESAGGEADLFRFPETLPGEVLEQMHAAPAPDVPEVTLDVLKSYDAFMFGIPTRFGNVPTQFKTFWDSTGGLWAEGALIGKPFGLFISTGTGGGKETTAKNSMSSFVHHGMSYIPLGYGGEVFPLITNIEEVIGATPWGSGTVAGSDGSRQPSESELKIAHLQGERFYPLAEKLVIAKPEPKKEADAKEKTVDKGEATPPRQTQAAPKVESKDSCIKCVIM